MPTSCAPPESVRLWAAALLAGAGALVVVALALAPLELGYWRSRYLGALRLFVALFAVGLAEWSLLLRSHLQIVSDLLASRYEADPYYCYGGLHAPLGIYNWQRQTAALIDPLQHQALITSGATVVFLFVVMALATLRWSLRRRQARRAAVPASAIAVASNVRSRARLGGGRMFALAVVLLLILASLGDFAAIQVRNAMAQTPLCATGMSAADYQQLRGAGIALLPSQNDEPVDARTALATSKQGLGETLPTHVTCIVTQLAFVDSSGVAEVPRFALVWVVGYRIPGATAGPNTLATAPGVEWTFVNAQTGVYLYGAYMSTVGGR